MDLKKTSSEMKDCFTSALVQDIDDMFKYPDVSPRVGDEYQAEIPSLQTSASPGSPFPDSSNFDGGLPIPVMWVSKQSKNSIEEGNCSPLPRSQVEPWDVTEHSLFLLGLYIFGKNLALVKRFVGSKSTGDVLSYYYGKFYRTRDYLKWSEGRKSNNKRWIRGIKIFTGWRLQELVSRLSFYLSDERQKMLIEASRMVGEDKITMEEYVFTLKDWVGNDMLVDAIAIGKGKRDLTGTGMEPLKATQSVRTRPDIPAGKDFSSLSSVEILEVLTGDSRLSKARSSDLFFEAVWPRLLAKGWQSIQPRDSFSKLSVIFLPPGIVEFSQGLIRGEEYFDSISDILKKVASESKLLELEEEAVQVKEPPADDMIYSPKQQEDKILSKDQRHSFLQRPLSHRNDSMEFMVVDTSLVSENEQMKVREWRSLPVGRKNTNKSRYSASERKVSTNVTDHFSNTACSTEKAHSGANLVDDELLRDSAELIGIFGKPGDLKNIITDEQAELTGQPLNIVASIPEQLSLIACSKRELRHAIGNICTEESFTESSKELSSSSSASSHVEVLKTNHDGVLDENSYRRTGIDLNISHASLGSGCEEEMNTNEMLNNVNLPADRKSYISDISNDPNAADLSSFNGRVDQEQQQLPIENGRRQSTRNRPSARALEAIANGFFDTKKKKRKTMSILYR